MMRRPPKYRFLTHPNYAAHYERLYGPTWEDRVYRAFRVVVRSCVWIVLLVGIGAEMICVGEALHRWWVNEESTTCIEQSWSS